MDDLEFPFSDLILKLLTIGDSGAGKTSLINRYVVLFIQENIFSYKFISTIGVDCKSKIVLLNDYRVKIQVWDTAGQERFRTITSNYYRGSHGVAVVYDVTDRQSFETVSIWLKEIQKHAEEEIVIVLLANKVDMTNLRLISEEEGEKFAEENNLYYFETSAKDGSGVEEAFEFLGHRIMSELIENTDMLNNKPSFILNRTEASQNGKKRKCC